MFKSVVLLILLTMNCAHCIKEDPSDVPAQTSAPLATAAEILLRPCSEYGCKNKSCLKHQHTFPARQTKHESSGSQRTDWWGQIDPLDKSLDALELLTIGQRQKHYGWDGKLQSADRFTGFAAWSLLWTVERAQLAVFKDYQKNRGRSSLVDLTILAQEIAILEKYRNHWSNNKDCERLFLENNDIYNVFDAYYRWAILHPEDSDKGIGPFGRQGIPFYGSPLAGVPGQNKFMRQMAFFMDVIQQDALRVMAINMDNMARRSVGKESLPYPPLFAMQFNEGDRTDEALSDRESSSPDDYCPSDNETSPENFEEDLAVHHSVSSDNESSPTGNQLVESEEKAHNPRTAFDHETSSPAHKVSFYYEPESVMEQCIRLQHLMNGDKPHHWWTLEDYVELSKLKSAFTADVWWQFTGALLNKKIVFKVDTNCHTIKSLLDLCMNIFKTFDDTQVPARMAECYLLFANSIEGDKSVNTPQRMTDLLISSLDWTLSMMAQYVNKQTLRCDAQIGVNLFPKGKRAFRIGPSGGRTEIGDDYRKYQIPQSTQNLFRSIEDTCSKFMTRFDEPSNYFHNRGSSRNDINESLQAIRAFMKHYHISFATPPVVAAEAVKVTEPPSMPSAAKTPITSVDDDGDES